MDIWGLGDKYQVQVLLNEIVELRPEFVTEANVLNLILQADAHGVKDITDFCLGYVVEHLKSVVQQEEAIRALPQHLLADFIVAQGH